MLRLGATRYASGQEAYVADRCRGERHIVRLLDSFYRDHRVHLVYENAGRSMSHFIADLGFSGPGAACGKQLSEPLIPMRTTLAAHVFNWTGVEEVGQASRRRVVTYVVSYALVDNFSGVSFRSPEVATPYFLRVVSKTNVLV